MARRPYLCSDKDIEKRLLALIRDFGLRVVYNGTHLKICDGDSVLMVTPRTPSGRRENTLANIRMARRSLEARSSVAAEVPSNSGGGGLLPARR